MENPDSETDRYFVYIVQCKDKTLYTGIARDVESRVKEHNKGINGARYTKSRRPVKLLYQEPVEGRSEAQSREYEIKQLTKEQKLTLIKDSAD